MQQNRSITIDILRTFAALAVVFYHFGFWSWAYHKSTPYIILEGRVFFPELTSIASSGWVGVEIFFVISGLVIFNSASGSDASTFFVKRFLRLWPAAAVCACLTAVFLLLNSAAPITVAIAVAKTVTFWPFYGWVDAVYWTLGIEIAFYGLVFFLLLVGAPRFIETIIVCIGIASISYWLWTLTSALLAERPSISFLSERLTQLLLLQHGIYFALGGLMQAAQKGGWTVVRVLLALAFTIMGIFPIIAKSLEDAKLTGLDLSEMAPAAIWLIALLLIFCSDRIDSFVDKLPNRMKAIIERVGLATYPLYLVHTVVGSIIMKFAIDFGATEYVALLIGFLCVSAFSFGTIYIEKAIRRVLMRYIKLGLNPTSPPSDMAAIKQ